MSHDLNLNISGTGKGLDYSFSGGMLRQQGMIINSSGEAGSLVRAESALLTAVPRAELPSNPLFGENNPGY